MTKWEFQEICRRAIMANERPIERIDSNWLTPLLLLEAEQDRNSLIALCRKLGKENKALKEKLNEKV